MLANQLLIEEEIESDKRVSLKLKLLRDLRGLPMKKFKRKTRQEMRLKIHSNGKALLI